MYSNIVELSRRFPLILASGSPRRKSLLTEIGCSFRIESHEVDETLRPDELPYEYAVRLAQEKALAVAAVPGSIVLGFDTIVVIDSEVLGKPVSPEDACAMLRRLSGNAHVVCTAIALAQQGRIFTSGYDLTTVRFKMVTGEQIAEYVRNGEPMDKAGAYGIQGMGGFLVDSIEGNLDTVIGLPRNLLDQFCAALLEARR
jgi:septum formation protein